MTKPDGQVAAGGRGGRAALVVGIVLVVVGVAALLWSVTSRSAAVEQARAREAKLGRHLATVAAQAHRIDGLFLRQEGILRHLAETAAFLVQHGVEGEAAPYGAARFDAEGQGPSDLAAAPLYGRAISLLEPVYKLAPGVAEETVLPTLKRLSLLRTHYRRLIAASRPGQKTLGEDELRRVVTSKKEGVPLRWAYVGLETGVMFSYPGKGGYPADYDPRRRPWYALGKEKTEPCWGTPYPDVMGQGLVLPGVVGVQDDAGRFLGVAGVEMTLDWVIDRFLLPQGLGDVGETFLLDPKGRVLLRSNERDVRIPEAYVDDNEVLDVFSVPEVVTAVRRNESGLVRTPDPEGEVIVAYFRIPTIGWTYAHRAELPRILEVFE